MRASLPALSLGVRALFYHDMPSLCFSYDGEVLKDFNSSDATHIITDKKPFAEVGEPMPPPFVYNTFILILPLLFQDQDTSDAVLVLKPEWVRDCLKKKQCLPTDNYEL